MNVKQRMVWMKEICWLKVMNEWFEDDMINNWVLKWVDERLNGTMGERLGDNLEFNLWIYWMNGAKDEWLCE